MSNSPLSQGEKKSLFLLALRHFGGNVTRACEAAQVARQTYYNWKEDDEDFEIRAKLIALECSEELMDEAEDIVRFALKDPREGTTTAKWILSKLGKARGWSNKVQIEHLAGEGFKGNEWPDEDAKTVEDWENEGSAEKSSASGEPEAKTE